VSALSRRLRSVPALFAAALALVLLAPLWLPVAAIFDLARGRTRLPTTRLLLFALCWSWLELAGVAAAAGLWMIGQRRNRRAHYALQRWWAEQLMRALTATTGLRIEAADADSMSPGPVVLLCRHASLADSLLSAWIITTKLGMHPRYVLKRELLLDPCLDIVGNRLPNHFLDREATDSTAELAAIAALGVGLASDDVAVIFPEGTRAAPAKRAKALARLAERDPVRSQRLAPLEHLLPPRPAGSQALVDGCPGADVVIGWHVGFDGLDTFGGILRHLSRTPPPVRFQSVRIPRVDVPTGDGFVEWLDQQWLAADRAVGDLLPKGSA
jgi:1-acyl-sn-glycerol-3-phosphate acyltransferase